MDAKAQFADRMNRLNKTKEQNRRVEVVEEEPEVEENQIYQD